MRIVIVVVFGIKYSYRIVKAFTISLGKMIINDYWIESELGIEYIYRKVKVYRMGR